MKIFAIRDDNDKKGKNLGYLLYYETEKRFYIELPDNADPWETPLLLSSFAARGENTVNSYWSKLWVQQRIVPPDRQNIGQILRDNGLKIYDEYDLMMLSSGRCEQDDYYLVAIDEKLLPNDIVRRFKWKIEDVVPLKDFCLLVFFRDGIVKKCDVRKYMEESRHFSIIINHQEYFNDVRVQTGGYGVQWDDNQSIPDSVLYQMGKRVPLTVEDFRMLAAERIINAAEAAGILGCSRQYVNELVKSEKLHPIKATEKNTLFMKNEVMQRKWNT
ncbi:MAG: DUF2442 domain-containing protein [Clostridia bacterium]|nr:DUF2442 domain-containing protein [Clostridia bacterium]